MATGSPNTNFQSECSRILGLNTSDDLAANFEPTLKRRLNGIVDRLGDKAPSTSRRRPSVRRADRQGSSAAEEVMEEDPHGSGEGADEQTQEEEFMMETEGEYDAQQPDRAGTIWDFL
jgi:hypothetical protein